MADLPEGILMKFYKQYFEMFCIEMTLYIFFNPACPELHLPFEHSFNYFVKVSS